MNNVRGYRTRIGTLGLGLLLAACSGTEDENENEHRSDPPNSGVVAELKSNAERVAPAPAEAASAAKSEQTFAFSFLRELDEDENTAFSPHSISAAFAMVTDAARGKTLDEVEHVLCYVHADEAFHRSQDALKLALAARNRPAVNSDEQQVDAQILDESNDIWIRNDAPPQDSYLDTLARFYGAGVHQADFERDAEGARQAINAKVSTDTRDLIPELLPEKSLDDSTVAVLTNALYFKAPWASPFTKPQAGDFTTLAGATISADMLSAQRALAYYEGQGFVSVGVPYWGEQLEMLLVVPDAGDYSKVRANLSSELLDNVLRARQAELVQLTLPKFSLKSNVSATKVLKDLGMKTPFDEDAAEFPKLTSPLFPQVFISDVFHQATVAIDEKGTEASAATAIVVAGVSSAPLDPPKPKLVTVDRPFLFVIRDNPTGSVLFVGQVVDPSQK